MFINFVDEIHVYPEVLAFLEQAQPAVGLCHGWYPILS